MKKEPLRSCAYSYCIAFYRDVWSVDVENRHVDLLAWRRVGEFIHCHCLTLIHHIEARREPWRKMIRVSRMHDEKKRTINRLTVFHLLDNSSISVIPNRVPVVPIVRVDELRRWIRVQKSSEVAFFIRDQLLIIRVVVSHIYRVRKTTDE